MEHPDFAKAKLPDPRAVAEVLKKAVGEIKKGFKYSSLTFLLTDGKTLYAYRDRDPQFDDYYTLFTTKADRAQIICSEILPAVSSSWIPVPNETFVTLTV